MGESNNTTINSYNKSVDRYIERSPIEVKGFLKGWIDKVFGDLDKDIPILEIGSGGGRDADYLESHLQFTNVTRSDASIGFVERLRDRGIPAEWINILDGSTDEKYDVIFADAVILHFDQNELLVALQNVCDSLNDNGEFHFTTARAPEGAEGSVQIWSDNKLGLERFFNKMTEDDLVRALRDAGFNDTAVEVDDTNTWFHVSARKGVVI